MADLACRILHGIEHLEARHDFSGGEDLDLELVVGRLRDQLAHDFRAAIERIERFRPARRHAPFDLRHRLRKGRSRDRRAARDAKSSDFEKVSSFHVFLPDDRDCEPSC
jgi:hypothetical protein